MPRSDAVLYVRVPPGIRNRVVELAASEGISTNAWCARELLRATLQHDTMPHDATPHDATAHITIVDVIRSTVETTPLIAPCGRNWPCALETRTTLSGRDYCGGCGVLLP